MKFHVEHTFTDISLPAYEALFFDEAFNIALCKATNLSRDLQKREIKDGKFAREVKVGPDREVPAPVAKVIGSNRIQYIEKLNYTVGTHAGTWETLPMVLADKVVSRGTFGFYQKGDRIVRVVDGEVTVKVFGIGGVIEKLVIADVERTYNHAAKFMQDWIAQKEVPQKIA